MGLTERSLATLVADAPPPELRGTAFGMFNPVTAPSCDALVSRQQLSTNTRRADDKFLPSRALSISVIKALNVI